MKHFNLEHRVAAAISKILYKYQRNDERRAKVQSSLL